MKNELIINKKIQIRRSPIHGWGIFATEDIQKGEILEESPFIIVPMSVGESSSLFLDYRFNYPSGDVWQHQVIPFGFCCLYNHSNDPNVVWTTDTENKIFIFTTIKDVKKDEELFCYYGGSNYWEDGRTHVEVK